MRVLYVYCHPLDDSFHATIRKEALAGLKEAGHEIDLLDLYAEGFDPVLGADRRRDYHDPERNHRNNQAYADRLMAANAMVVQFPTWSFGPPAMLKGWFDRMFGPGIALDLSDPAQAKPMLQHIERITGIFARLQNYQVRSLTVGKEAQGEAIVEIAHNNRVFHGKAASTDIIAASAQAYLKALNKAAANQHTEKPIHAQHE